MYDDRHWPTFLGTQAGNFIAYDGESGERLWEFDLDEAPISGRPDELV